MTQDERERLAYYDTIPIQNLLVPELEDYLKLQQKRITELEAHHAGAKP